MKTRTEEQKRKAREYSKEWRKNNPKYLQIFTEEQKAKGLERLKAWAVVHPERTKQAIREWQVKNRWRESVARLERKQLVIDTYGGKCVWENCGITDIDLLTIDHVEDNGAQDRKEKGHITGDKMCRLLVKLNFPSGFQILCANHQLKKQVLKYRKEAAERNGINA
jgi:hypothetical protein